MSCLVCSGRCGQASTNRVKSGSAEGLRASSAPLSAQTFLEIAVFGGVRAIDSSPHTLRNRHPTGNPLYSVEPWLFFVLETEDYAFL